MRRAGIAADAEQERERLIASAFIGWQMGAGAGQKFGRYLRGLGLSRPDGSSRVSRRVDAQAAIEDARRIAAADKRQRDG